jgi:thiamine pyrophosphokinase
MKAVILCDGHPPLLSQIETETGGGVLFIAADGGANSAAGLGLEPDIIIGDLDSYTVKDSESARVIRDPDQETNDLEKALNLARSESAAEVIIFGATGKRLDHTLKNLSVLKQFHEAFQSILIRDRYADIFLADSPFVRSLPLFTPVSLYPLSGRVEGITTRGLKYPLIDGFLENGIRDGSSNLTIEKTVEIVYKKGDLLLFVHHQTETDG